MMDALHRCTVLLYNSLICAKFLAIFKMGNGEWELNVDCKLLENILAVCYQVRLTNNYSHSHKTVNTRENFWNVYCFATNQMRDETAKDNRQTAAWISHDLTQSNELALSSTTNLQFYRFQILKLFFLYFRFLISKE